ncbi:hypothetical protein GCM10009133_32100 [Cocleimonas flava]|uniref:Peptidase MA-like domain-containing protein n=1 Tax=Cocleimonas flava TaxID=634765 RepID=A0A4V2P9B1_9GAMM|nr:hypothetical protein [Cocleimonas flava]TCJ88945.1 hypothetical protein EV695_0805 [Cocleimonas flava]
MILRPVRVYVCYLLLLLTILSGSFSSANANANSEYHLTIKGSSINLRFSPEMSDKHLALDQQTIVNWIEKSAIAVADYFEQFPVKNLKIAITPGSGSRIGGNAYYRATPLIVLRIQPDITEQQLQQDWVLVHEMVHLAFPLMEDDHGWAQEGLATYVEPLVRLKAGIVKEKDVWLWLLKGTPNGIPKEGERGLDNTRSWGMKYWGGAIYFLLADIEIREQTNNKLGLEDALRAINHSGASMAADGTWPISEVFSIGDKAVGTQTLMNLYNKMKSKAFDPELENIWKKFGISLKNDQIKFDQSKSLARQKFIFGVK